MDRRFTFGGAFAFSSAIHLCALAIALSVVVAPIKHGTVDAVTLVAPKDVRPTPIIFLLAPGGGGGGGGGNRQNGPIRRAAGRGDDRITLRVTKPIELTNSPLSASPLLPTLLLDARPLASGTTDVLGLPSGGVPSGTSLGPGSGGVGSGYGSGMGSGTGPGFGEGRGGGTGGGVYRVGGGVTTPLLLREVRPAYTSDALQRRIQGSVVLELVVTPTGIPSHIRVVQSLESSLDAQAVNAVTQWLFKPGELRGMPVKVLVIVVLDFTIH